MVRGIGAATRARFVAARPPGDGLKWASAQETSGECILYHQRKRKLDSALSSARKHSGPCVIRLRG